MLKRKVQNARAQLNRARRLRLVDYLEHAKSKHKKHRAEYVKQIRYSKTLIWQKFFTEKGDADLQGLVYKILRNKTCNNFNTFHAIREGSETILT